MRRLIIIGNGFDLAHNMNTRYYDFILDYLKKSFKEASDKVNFEDDLIKVFRRRIPIEKSVEDRNDINEFIYFKDPILKKTTPFPVKSMEHSSGRYQIKDFAMEIKSEFFNHLLKNCCDFNWVDIENEYYAQLKSVLALNDTDSIEKLNDLNKTLNCIISILGIYLKSQNPERLSNEYARIFREEIKKEEVVTVTLEEDIYPSSTMILNFNYTDTVNRYFSSPDSGLFQLPMNITYIHGKLGDQTNPIIFGFGDELDSDYMNIEGDKRKGFFEFIKSFWYFKSSNYHDLIRFIQTEDFQVYIIGHSCGLSDRTMLNMIFEHNNCKSIKIFYHKKENQDNFTELTQEISRHFKDKTMMRKKIVPLPYSIAMPQL